VLDDTGYRTALLAKLVEEAQEAGHATAADLPGELADVLEVLQALTATAGMSWSQLLALAAEKRSSRGAFEDRIFLEFVVQQRRAARLLGCPGPGRHHRAGDARALPRACGGRR
jgi:predicted house-cleaning noncanonical NTP pyrophosphatase (MazG superfamily)